MKRQILLYIATLTFVHAQQPAFSDTLKSMKADCKAAKDTNYCEVQQTQFADDWKAANEGSYGAQRNVAFCLKNSCDGAVVTDTVAGCSWRIIIQAAHNDKDDADRWSYEADCRSLTNQDRRSALDLAEKAYKKIYRRQMPLDNLLR